MKKKHIVTMMLNIEFIAVFAINFAIDRYYSNHLKSQTHITLIRKRQPLNNTNISTPRSQLGYCIQLQTYEFLKSCFFLTRVTKDHSVIFKFLISISIFINLLDQKLNSSSFSYTSSDSHPIKI